TRRNQVVLHLLTGFGTSPDLDTGGINALLLDQVVLRVDSALRCHLRTLLLIGCRVANHNSSRIRLTLQVEGYVIQAGLGFVVDASRTALVTIEVDRAERLRLGLRRWWRRFHVDRAGRRGSLTLVVGDIRRDSDRTGRSTRGVQGRRSVVSADLTGGS